MELKELFLGKQEISARQRKEIINSNIRQCQNHLNLSDEQMHGFLEFLEKGQIEPKKVKKFSLSKFR